MILEAIVTTLNDDGTLNVAPMGLRVETDLREFTLRPFRTSRTYHNLKARREGVLHVTDDSLMFALGAIGELPEPATEPAERVRGRVILDVCRFAEFLVRDVDDRDDRTLMLAETVREQSVRDFFGFNRAKHAILEAAIMATRVDWIPLRRIRRDFRRLGEVVGKTGGPNELVAFRRLSDHVGAVARSRGFAWSDDSP